MSIELKEAVKRLERACIAGMDEEYCDDVLSVLGALAARQEEEWMKLAKAGKEAAACKAYLEIHGTSLREAYDAVKRWNLQQAKPEVQ